LLQFAKFRQLLKEVILLNDRLQKYTEKRLHLYTESCADESEDLPSLDSAKKCMLDDASTDSVYSSAVLNESSQNCDSKPTERRIVRIVSATDHCQRNSVSSSEASQPVAESFTMIDDQESIKIRVTVGMLCA